MRLIDILRISFSTFANNKMRTILTILGVSIGISTIVFLVSIGYGLQQITIGEIKSIKALTTYSVTTGNSSILALNDKAVEDFKKITNVVSANPLISMSGQISYDGKKTDILVNDASAEYVDLESPKLVAGSNYTGDNDNKIIVTSIVASAFNMKSEELLNKEATITFYIPNPADAKAPIMQEKKLQVSGIIKDDTASYIYLPSGIVPLPANSAYSAVKVKVDTDKHMAAVKDTLTKAGYKTSSIGERISEMNRIFNIAQIVLLVFGAIALMVASIGMFNTLTISLLERTKDIGIMKALGATDSSVYSIFLAESVIISLGGGMCGIIIAMVLGYLANLFVSMLAIRAGGESVMIFQPPILFVAIIFAFSLLVGVLTGLYPARRASHINPLDALRYE